MNLTAPTPRRQTVLVVDDTPENLSIMIDLLQDEYQVKVAPSGERGLQIARGDVPPDLVLLDIMMPDMDGYATCAQLKADPRTRDIPVIFLTALSDALDEEMGLGLGAVDYITKPIQPLTMLARVRTHLSLKAASEFLRDQNAFLDEEVDRRVAEARDIQQATALMLCTLAELGDDKAQSLVQRKQICLRKLGAALREHHHFRDQLNDATIELLVKSAPLHTIGTLGIPERILRKSDALTPEEADIVKARTALSRDAIAQAFQYGRALPLLSLVSELVSTRFERWDGDGHPSGLQGNAIPLSTRLMAVVDAYAETMRHGPFNDSSDQDAPGKLIVDGRGRRFDPDVVDALLQMEKALQASTQPLPDL